MKKILFISTSLLACAALVPTTAFAQSEETSADSGIGDIVVTAQRRAENLQNVPIAITALTSDSLKATGVSSTADLKAAVPGLDFSTALGSVALPNIRGVGTGAGGPGVENPVALYIDNVYIGPATNGMLSLNDIEQVAVLKGPQGTLFGRNATGGLLQITTRSPKDTFAGSVHANVGNLGTYGGDLFLTGPISDTVAASLSVFGTNQTKGFGKNLNSGKDVDFGSDFAARIKLQWKPGPDTTVTLSGDYGKSNATGPNFNVAYGSRNVIGQLRSGEPWDTNVNFEPQSNNEGGGASLNIQQDMGKVRLVSISAYRTSTWAIDFDNDLTPANLTGGHFRDTEKSFSQEVQLQSHDKGPLQWTIGGFYYSSRGRYDPVRIDGPNIAFAPLGFGFPPGAAQIRINSEQKTESLAAFAQATYAIGPNTNITGGIRYTTDKKDFAATEVFDYPGGITRPFPDLSGFGGPNLGAAKVSQRFNRTNFRASLDHRFSPEVLVYASFNTGFKSGLFSPASVPAQLVKPEYLTAYEIGLKADLFDRKARFNLAAFKYNYTNVQVLAVFQGIGIIANGDGAKMEGIDADLTLRPTDNLTITSGFSWVNARYTTFKNAFLTAPEPAFGPCPTSRPPGQTPLGGNCMIPNAFDASGKKMQLVPEYTFNLGASYNLPGNFTLSGHYYYNNGWFADPQNIVAQGKYGLLDASLVWNSPDKHYNVRIYGKNLANTNYSSQLITNDNGNQRSVGPGRTYGITLGYDF